MLVIIFMCCLLWLSGWSAEAQTTATSLSGDSSGALSSNAVDSTALIMNDGKQCLNVRVSTTLPESVTSDTYFDPITSKCTQCSNGSINANTNYVVNAMSPVNLNILRYLRREKKLSCICDMSRGYANGNAMSNFRAVTSPFRDAVNFTIDAAINPPPQTSAVTSSSLASPVCTKCSDFGPYVPSIVLDEASGAQGCVACGTVQGTLLHLLSASAGTAFATQDPANFANLVASLQAGNIQGTHGILADAAFVVGGDGAACQCPLTHVITETIGGVRLPFQVCVLCRNGAVDSRDPSLCHECIFPFQYDGTTKRCSRCANGYTMMPDGLCELTSRLNIITAMQIGALSTTTTSITPLNWNNQNAESSPFPSLLLSANLNAAGVRCLGGKNQTACQLLANLCVLSNYNLRAAACMVYRGIQRLEGCVSADGGDGCEVPTTVPWLYYLRSSSSILEDRNFKKHVTLGEALKFVVESYAANGTWIGSEAVVAQLFNCETTSESALNFFAVGSQRRLECQINLPFFVVADETVFYELFIEMDDGELFPVPVMAAYSRAPLRPVNLGDRRLYKAAARGAELTPEEGAYRRRFYFYDNIGGRSASSTSSSSAFPTTAYEALPKTSYVTFPHTVRMLVEVRPEDDSTIYVPLLLMQYASFPTDYLYQLLNENPMYLTRARYLRTTDTNDDNRVVGDDKELRFLVPASTSAIFSNQNKVEEALMITLIVTCCACFISSWIRTYGWMRRQQNALLGPSTLMRWFVYLCNHISTVFCGVIVLTSWILYLFYKNQANVSYMMPPTSKYLLAMLYTAVSCKGVVVLYRIVEQCNADIFVIDWERSKGQLLREKKQVPVSMWRSTFLANELNEMQTLRAWHPLFTMMVVLLFLEGLGYINYARTIPYASLRPTENTAPSNPILRIAVSALFWYSIAGGIYIIEHYFYYRFVHVHPLRAFVDLCSVSNISLMILLEPQWGFYIHGESIHAHSDVSMVEFQENLKRESQGLMPARGLGGQEQCQSFEVFIGPNLRNYLYCAYSQLLIENVRSLNSEASGGAPVVSGQHRKLFEFLLGRPGLTKTFTEETLEVKRLINDAFTQSVRSAEKYLMHKFALHRFFDFPPNILFMNGPFANEEMMGKDLYFLDDYWHYGKFLLCGIDFDLFLLYTLLFFAIDTSLNNSYVAMIIVYLVDLILVQYRKLEGQANMGAKTLFDERFFL